MTDPRAATRATYARWLCIRASVRALALSLAAAEHELRRDARRNADEAEMATLFARLHAERGAIDALENELDDRIAAVKREYDAIEGRFVNELIAVARRTPVRETAIAAAKQAATCRLASSPPSTHDAS